MVLLVEALAVLVATLARLTATPEAVGPIDARPADGIVPLVGLPGVEATANEVDPSLRSFRRLAPTSEPFRVRSTGIRRPLLGRVGLFSVFVGRDGSDWSDQEVMSRHSTPSRGWAGGSSARPRGGGPR